MKKEYEIKKEPVTLGDGSTKIKYNIYYYEDDKKATSVPHKEFHSYDGINGTIREGYTEKTK